MFLEEKLLEIATSKDSVGREDAIKLTREMLTECNNNIGSSANKDGRVNYSQFKRINRTWKSVYDKVDNPFFKKDGFEVFFQSIYKGDPKDIQ